MTSNKTCIYVSCIYEQQLYKKWTTYINDPDTSGLLAWDALCPLESPDTPNLSKAVMTVYNNTMYMYHTSGYGMYTCTFETRHGDIFHVFKNTFWCCYKLGMEKEVCVPNVPVLAALIQRVR